MQAAVEALLGGQAAAEGHGPGAGHGAVRRVPAQGHQAGEAVDRGIQAAARVLIDQEKCLLAQGLLCLGPATRGGCGALCIKGNMPCTGCFGPDQPRARLRRQGALGASPRCSRPTTTRRSPQSLEPIPDPVGTFYRYSLPASLLRAKKMEA